MNIDTIALIDDSPKKYGERSVDTLENRRLTSHNETLNEEECYGKVNVGP